MQLSIPEVIAKGRILDTDKYYLNHDDSFDLVTYMLESGEKLWVVFANNGDLRCKNLTESGNPKLEFDALVDLAENTSMSLYFYAVRG